MAEIITNDASYWIRELSLLAHPEGGYYKEVYRANEFISKKNLPTRFSEDCPFSTSIYFLLTGDTFSAFHRIQSDEMWHFYSGTSLTIFEIDSSGNLTNHKLGNNPQNGESFQVVIQAGNWFAACVDKVDSYTLAGCTVSPGFNFADFELANRKDLIIQYPQHQGLIEKYIR